MSKPIGLQRAWGTPISIEMSLEGAGGVVFVLGVLAGRVGGSVMALTAMIAGLVCIALATLVLIFDLGMPLRAPFVFLNPRSPMSLGAYSLLLFAALGVLTGAFWVFGWPKTGLYLIVAALASVFAAGVVLYPGFVLGVCKGVPLWRSSLLPVIFAATAIASGLGLYLTLAAILHLAGAGLAGPLGSLGTLSQWTLLAVAAATLIVLSNLVLLRATPTGARSVAAFVRHAAFWPSVLLGVILPLVILSLAPASAVVALAAGVASLLGWFGIRHLFLSGAAMEPMQAMGAAILPL